jgi:hypothetical protein
MKISTVLDRIDSGAVALPEFQRGYVWGRRQVRNLVESLYRRFPVGSLLLWETATESAEARGEGELQRGYVSLLLDGQQRITSLYGLARGTPPPFFDGDPRAFEDLRFHVETEEFAFYAPVRMRDDPLWIDVSAVLQTGPELATGLLPALGDDEAERLRRFGVVNANVNRLYGIREIDLHAEQITGEDKTIDVVVELFNRVNTGGTKLSNGDLALARLCAAWPEARGELKTRLQKWEGAGFRFSLEWLLRNVNAIVTGRAEFTALTEVPPARFREGVEEAERAIDGVLNLTSSRLGLDHHRVLGGIGAIPVMSRFLKDRGFRLPDAATADRLLYWYVHCLLWGRYAGSTETVLNVDLLALQRHGDGGDPLHALIAELRRQRGDLRIGPDDFRGWSKGARFYPLLYMLSRVSGARDLASGVELRRHLLGRHSALEVHHVFPKGLLQRHGFARADRNALGNFTFLTLETNRSLSDRAPADYLQEMERRHPGVVASHWIPDDPDLWAVERYPDFLERRRRLLADAANRLLDELLGGASLREEEPSVLEHGAIDVPHEDDEARAITALQDWMSERGLNRGVEDLAILSLDASREEAVLDVGWPDGLEHGEEKVALLLNEPEEVRDAAGRHGYRYFTSIQDLQAYVCEAVLAAPV